MCRCRGLVYDSVTGSVSGRESSSGSGRSMNVVGVHKRTQCLLKFFTISPGI